MSWQNYRYSQSWEKSCISISDSGYENREKIPKFQKTSQLIVGRRKKQISSCSYQRFWHFYI